MSKLISSLSLFIACLFATVPAKCDEPSSKAANPVIILETTSGSMEIVLYPDIAPKACENFIKLAQKGFYNGVIFHRIIKNFMIQGGDPTGTGRGGASIFGKPFEDEFSNEVLFDRPGRLAMANAGPNTNGSQFFITVTQTPWLNKKHTIFGQVISGLDSVKKLESCGSPAGYVSPMQSITRMYLKTTE